MSLLFSIIEHDIRSFGHILGEKKTIETKTFHILIIYTFSYLLFRKQSLIIIEWNGGIKYIVPNFFYYFRSCWTWYMNQEHLWMNLKMSIIALTISNNGGLF